MTWKLREGRERVKTGLQRDKEEGKTNVFFLIMDEEEEEMDGGAFALALRLWDFGTFRYFGRRFR
jgi:hypothetical protein